MNEEAPRPCPRPYRRVIKTCRECGGQYWGRKHGYCSSACGETARARHLAGVSTAPLKRGLLESTVTQKDERNHSAIDWSLRSPEGESYQFRNLAHFVRTHSELFAPDDLLPHPSRPTSLICRAVVGLGQLHPGRKMKRKPQSWKGWTWTNAE